MTLAGAGDLGVVMSLHNYSDDELRQLLRLVQSVKGAALLDLQRRFLTEAESWLHHEIGRRAQLGAAAMKSGLQNYAQ